MCTEAWFMEQELELRKIITVFIFLVLAGAAFMFFTRPKTDQPLNNANGEAIVTEVEKAGPEQVLEAGIDYKAVFKTNKGDFTIDLYESNMPITTNNFVYLAKSMNNARMSGFSSAFRPRKNTNATQNTCKQYFKAQVLS